MAVSGLRSSKDWGSENGLTIRPVVFACLRSSGLFPGHSPDGCGEGLWSCGGPQEVDRHCHDLEDWAGTEGCAPDPFPAVAALPGERDSPDARLLTSVPWDTDTRATCCVLS